MRNKSTIIIITIFTILTVSLATADLFINRDITGQSLRQTTVNAVTLTYRRTLRVRSDDSQMQTALSPTPRPEISEILTLTPILSPTEIPTPQYTVTPTALPEEIFNTPSASPIQKEQVSETTLPSAGIPMGMRFFGLVALAVITASLVL